MITNRVIRIRKKCNSDWKNLRLQKQKRCKLVLNDRVRQELEVKEDVKEKLEVKENIVTTLAFLNFLKFFGASLLILAAFFFIETTFNANIVTMVFMIMGFCFLSSAIVWEDRLKRKIKHDVY